MKILLGLVLSFTLISCSSMSGKRKGPSPYSASWKGEMVTPVKKSECSPNDNYKKMDWKQLVSEAGSCVRAKNFFQVERVANHLSKIEPESHWGAYFLSMAAESRGDLPRAFWMIELALKKAPEDGIVLFQRGRLNWLQKNHDLAIKDLEDSVKRNSSIPEAHLLLAQVQFTKNEMSKAQSNFAKALSLDPRNSDALFGLGEIAFKKRKYEEAYSFHKRALSKDSRLAVSYVRLAQIQEIHYKDLPESLQIYKDLQRRVSLNRVDGTLPLDLDQKMKSLNAMIQQSVAASAPKKVSKREPSSKKVSE